MKPYLVRVQPGQGPAWSYTGLFAHGCDAISAALEHLAGRPGRISARPLQRGAISLEVSLLIVWIAACALAAMYGWAYAQRTDTPLARWQAAAQLATLAHLQQRAERDYSAWQQAVCGPETGFVTRPDGTRICTDKRGRATGQLLAGANP